MRVPQATLHYLTEHHISHMTDMVGNTSTTVGTILAAMYYGKDEDNAFGFARAWMCHYDVSMISLCLYLPGARARLGQALLISLPLRPVLLWSFCRL
jgi:hypothetical protein